VPPIAVLGPQHLTPNLAPTLDRLGVRGSVCAVTAGWQEREGELDELVGHIGRPCEDLQLYQLADTAFATEQALFEAHRARQDKLRFLQTLYRKRLDHAVDAAREMMAAVGDAEVVQRERRAAINAIRNLDRQHLRHIRDVHAAFETHWHPARSPLLGELHRRLAARIESSAAVLVAGGHVSVLVNRMRLFGLGPVLAKRPLVVWSAGAMALSWRLVLFHDTPPQGAGHAEVFDSGLAILPPMLPLPHASTRLRLDDQERVALLARRFGPEPAIALDPGACVIADGERWKVAERCWRLTSRGRLEAASASALAGAHR
jgi:hypothetical protein